jgi:trimeric autotransporter adhesin
VRRWARMSVRLPLGIVVAIVALLGVPASTSADPVTGPVPTWVPDGEVKAIAVSGRTAYIGGNFSRIAPYTGSSALFDASSGNLQKPWPEVEGVVNAVAGDGLGGWYLGGDFRAVGGVPRTDLAHVMPDGSLDPDWSPSTNGQVRALAVGADTVFAGGEFSAANGAPRGNLAGFTRATGAVTGFVGSVSGNGPATLFDPLGAHALLLIGSTLYTVGEFNQAQSGATIATRLRGAAFNVADSQVQAWNPSANRLINGIARDSDGADLFVGGRFSKLNVDPNAISTTGQARNGVGKVDETAGTADPDWVAPLQGSTDLRTLMVFGSQVYLAGTVRVAPAEAWPVASYSTIDNNAGLDVNWHPVPAGAVQSLAASGSTVYIGSGSSTDGLQPAIIGVDATSFPPSGTPSFAPALGRGREALPSGQSTGVRAIGANGIDVVAGGTFTNVGGVERRNLAAIDLDTGRPTGFNPPMKGQFSPFTSVNAVALTDDGLVWAGGDFVTEKPNERIGLAAFDAGSGAIASFHRDPTGGVSGVSALAASGSTVYVSGNFTQVGGLPRRNVAAVRNVPGEDGAVLPFDADVNGPVQALALAGDTLYLGGAFSSVNGSLAALKRDRRNLAAVDSTTGIARDWDPDADNAVRALAVAGDTVFAGGDFGVVNHSTPRQRIAAFDLAGGAARPWNPSADAPVRSLAVHGPTVFAGGDFASVNGAPRAGIAAVDALSGASEPLSLALSAEERNGPSSPSVTRVDALFASPQAGLLIGGSFVMRTPTPRAINLAAFGLPPLPPATGGASATTTPGDSTDPDLSLAVSRRRFAVSRAPTPMDGIATVSKKAPRAAPRGTTLRLRLSEPARVRFELLTKGKGRRVGKKCVKATPANRKRKRCARLTVKGAFSRSAPAGGSTVPFSGRVGSRALKRGSYLVRATPTDAAGNDGEARSLSIEIVG